MLPLHLNIAYQNMTQDAFDFIAGLNLQLEFYFSGDSVDVIELVDIQRLKKIVTANNFSSTLHAPFFDLNIGARDSGIRQVSFERLIWALETAARLGSDLVVIHPGYGPWVLQHNFLPWLKRAEKLLQKLATHAASLNLKIAFENIHDSTPDDLLSLLKAVDFPHVGICFDVGHYNVFSRLPMKLWFEALGEHIFECHLHDNDGSADQHLAIGDGKIDYLPLQDWLKSLPDHKKPVLTLELANKAQVIKSVNNLKSWQL